MTDDAAPAKKLDFDPVPALVQALGLPAKSIAAVIALLDEDNTVPFIARYRKERTGGLDEVQIREIETQRGYLVELEERRAAILASVAEQGKLTPELEAKLKAATGKAELEDLYAPYRPRRKTRASVAREKGLEPLAQKILAQGTDGDPAADAAAFVTDQVASADDALAGARDIVAETIADTAEVRAYVRKEYAEHGKLVSTVQPGKDAEPTKFEQYYNFEETVKTIPSHRFLAIRRGEAEGVLRAHVAVDIAKVEAGILNLVKHVPASPWGQQLEQAVTDALKRLLAPSVENDVRAELKTRSDQAAVDIFAGNLRNLLLAAPLGSASVVGVDPGLRTGCKCAAIDPTGKFLGTVTLYISQGDAQLQKAKEDFVAFINQHMPRAIAVGNGTGGREAEAFVKKTLAEVGVREGVTLPFVVQVNEAGASVYSASDLAREEFPELDLTIRGAISIARRLQDPLAELVKIEPKSIGVGQYQHDVHQTLLGKKLGDVVESCVNHVGVEINTASAQLLGYVAGIGKSLAKKIVVHRDTHGAFNSRAQLQDVSGLGPKAFEQAAGFFRIHASQNPLDASAVHPERYPLVEQMAKDLGVELPQLIGNQELVDKIDLSKYVQGDVGEPTLRDIVAELAKPGRDPRAEFSPPAFRDDVTTMEDLKPGMVLEGIVTNVTAFGAFVDIGVHNDGLVHVSQLAEKFVKDPSEVVKVGEKLKVRVLEVDKERKRIALSARPPARERQQQQGGDRPRGNRGGGGRGQQQQQGEGGGGGQRGPRGPRRGGGGPRGDGQQWQAGEGAQNAEGQGPRGGEGLAPLPGGPEGRAPGQGWQGQGGQSQGDQGQGDQGQRGQGQGWQEAQGQGQGGQGQGGQGQGGQGQGWQGQGPGGQGQGRAPRGPRGPRNDQRGDFRGAGGGGGRGGEFRGGRGGQGGQGGEQRGGEFRGGQGGQGGQGGEQRGGEFRGGQGGPGGGGQGGQGGEQRGGEFRGGQGGQGGGEFRGGQGGQGGQGGGGRGGDYRGGGGGGRGGDYRGGGGGRGGEYRGGGPRGDQRDFRGGGGGGGPRRDDRGPRRDEPPPADWGVQGFKNNPFAKLKGDGDKR